MFCPANTCFTLSCILFFRDTSQQRTNDQVSFRSNVRSGRVGFSRISPSCYRLNPGRCSLYAERPPGCRLGKKHNHIWRGIAERAYGAAGAVGVNILECPETRSQEIQASEHQDPIITLGSHSTVAFYLLGFNQKDGL